MSFLPPAPPVPRNPKQQQTAYSNASFWSDWYEKLRNIINNIGSNVNHNDLQNIQGGSSSERYHLTSAQATDLTDGGDSTSHYHASDRARANHTGTQTMATISDLPTLSSGTYTPTLTNVANLDASTAFQCQYMRVGTVVTVSGKVSVDPTLAATSTQLGISLPIASNLGAQEDCSGTAFASGIANQGAAILGDAANNRAQLQYVSGDVTNQPMYFTFTYEVI